MHLIILRKEIAFYNLKKKKYNKRNVLDTIEKYKLFLLKILIR